MYVPGKEISVDESMIGTKSRLSFLQYMPNKPTKWGVKVWVCSEAKTGYIHKFKIYTGKEQQREHSKTSSDSHLQYFTSKCCVNTNT